MLFSLQNREKDDRFAIVLTILDSSQRDSDSRLHLVYVSRVLGFIWVWGREAPSELHFNVWFGIAAHKDAEKFRQVAKAVAFSLKLLIYHVLDFLF